MKRILITGSTDGIGKLAATKLAGEGHQIYIHGRNGDKVAGTIAEIKSATNNEQIGGFVANFANLESVKSMAAEVKNQLMSLDVLINNAGVFYSQVPLNKQGYDLRYVVNYLAPFVLTEELIPLLEKGTDPRVINLSSAAQSSVSFDVLAGKANTPINAAYAQSKLALTMWSFHLATQVKDVTVIAVNPGSLLNTKMAKEAYGHYWAPADKGADILSKLALADEHRNHSGEYYDNDSGGYAHAHSDAYDKQLVGRLIQFTNKLIV